jgi:hypothetical protein
MSTADLVHQCVTQKFDCLIAICDQLSLGIVDRVQEQAADYALGTVSILIRDDSQREQAAATYNALLQYIVTHNIVACLDILFAEITLCYKLRKPRLSNEVIRSVEREVETFNTTTLQCAIDSVDYLSCPCGGEFVVESEISSLVCKKCGVMRKLHGTIFDDKQIAGSTTCKHATYDSTKHGKAWMDKIQAREDTDVTAVADAVKECARNDRVNVDHISCELIRSYLKRIKMTKFNDHVPAIRRCITGVAPPQFTDAEQKKINGYFDRAIRIFNKIKSGDRPNSPYHPYFLYKIIDQVITVEKRDAILACIHLQSAATLCKHDAIWRLICAEIPEFRYVPTVR